jgi:hypothetical protein
MSALFTVTISAYRIAPRVDSADTVAVYSSPHRSPHAAARKLASIIAGRSRLSRQVRDAIPCDYAGKYMIRTPSGSAFALRPFRMVHCGAGAGARGDGRCI